MRAVVVALGRLCSAHHSRTEACTMGLTVTRKIGETIQVDHGIAKAFVSPKTQGGLSVNVALVVQLKPKSSEN